MIDRGVIGGVALLPDDDEAVRARDMRRLGGSPNYGVENRTPSQKDVDRLLYASSFLRLSAVTQIATPDPLRPVVHNRLTHSLKVAQIARTITGNLIHHALTDDGSDRRELIKSLGGLDASVAEAAALAHDIGHPPFGHAGEAVLDRIAQDSNSKISVPDGFEGNAQSFRFAVKADPMYEYPHGLDLTAATNAAIVKYPWPRPTDELPVPRLTPARQANLRARKFGFYYSDKEEFEAARKWLPSAFNDDAAPRQSLEASIMDVADDITYAVHDYEDFITMGALNRDTVQADLEELIALKEPSARRQRPSLDPLIQGMQEYERFRFPLLQEVASEQLQNLPSLSISLWPFSREFRNSLLDKLLGGTSIELWEKPRSEVGAHIGLADKPWHLVEMLKFFVKHYVINSPSLALMQAGQGALLRKGVDRLVRWHDEDPTRQPEELRGRLRWAAENGETLSRAYLDYVCTLGDDQFEAITLSMSGERTLRLGTNSLFG